MAKKGLVLGIPDPKKMTKKTGGFLESWAEGEPQRIKLTNGTEKPAMGGTEVESKSEWVVGFFWFYDVLGFKV